MDNTELIQELAKKWMLKTPSEEYAYRMGVDYAICGANTTNCHFSIFSRPENTRAWERGKQDGEEIKNLLK